MIVKCSKKMMYPFRKILKLVRIKKMVCSMLPLLFAIGCNNSADEYIVYVGTYTGKGSEGIYAYNFNPVTGDLSALGLAAKTENPSFITIDQKGKFLYAVNEIDSFQNKRSGAISVFAIEKESAKLTLMQQVASMGAAPAHLSLDKSGCYLMVANYNGGNIASFPIGNDGLLGSHTAFVQHYGSGKDSERQSAPHAHYIQTNNDNRFVLAADLGIDKVLIYRFDSKTGSLTPNNPDCIKLQDGSGPRHLAFSPTGKFVYVLNELSSTVTVFEFEQDSGIVGEKQTISTLPSNFKGENTTAEILLDSKGKFLYVSNRGDNSIAVFSIDSNNGFLKHIEWVSSEGETPRNFEIDPTGKWLLAANQNSNNLQIFSIDPISGRLLKVPKSLKVYSPVCIRFLSM